MRPALGLTEESFELDVSETKQSRRPVFLNSGAFGILNWLHLRAEVAKLADALA